MYCICVFISWKKKGSHILYDSDCVEAGLNGVFRGYTYVTIFDVQHLGILYKDVVDPHMRIVSI